jgi:hypothetical protein
VSAGGSLQTAINSAVPGDVIVLQAGATFTGNFVLPKKTGTGWVTIRGARDAGIPSAGTRVSPTTAARFPKIVSPNSNYAIRTYSGAHHYRLVGLEITAASSVPWSYGLVVIGYGSSEQSTLDRVPTDIVIDRSYIHGRANLVLKRCVELNGAASAVIDSYVSGCHSDWQDSQAIAGWNGPGPFKIVNNYLEGAGENIIFGGADPKIPGLIPSDIEIRGNHLIKPLAWRGVWLTKNLLEFKNAQRVLIEGNVFENCWTDGQSGTAILFKSVNQNGTAPWSTTRDVTFRFNRVRNVGNGISISARPESHQVDNPTARIRVEHNVLDRVGGTGLGVGRLVVLSGKLADIAFEHNTGLAANVATAFGGTPLTRFRANDNIFVSRGGVYSGSGYGTGSSALAYHAPGYVFRGNVLTGTSGTYPATTTLASSTAWLGFVDAAGGDYRLAASSPLKAKASDGTDPGANVGEVQVKTAGAVRR